MPRLKSRTEFPPGGFLYTQSQVPQFKPPAGSFDVVVRAIIEMRRANRGITMKHNLPTDYETVAIELDEQNAARMLAHGWNSFVAEGGSPPTTFRRPQRLQAALAGAAVGNVTKTIAGIKIIADWWGSGLKPVAQTLAQKRADNCKTCVKNVDGDFWQRIEASVSQRLKQMIEVKNDMSLRVTDEALLKSCAVCDCWNQTAIWTPLENVIPNLTPAMINQLKTEAPNCWKITEQK